MPSRSFPRLRQLCNALPKSKLDEQFASLPALQRLLVFAVTTLVVLTVPPLLVDQAARPAVTVTIGFVTLVALTGLLARYNHR